MIQNLSFHHVGVLVEDLDSMSSFYIKLFGMSELFRRKAKYIRDHIDVEIIFLKKDDFIIELIGPVILKSNDNKAHLALTLKNVSLFIDVLVGNNIKYELNFNTNGEVDFIKFKDPELNVIEIFETNFNDA